MTSHNIRRARRASTRNLLQRSRRHVPLCATRAGEILANKMPDLKARAEATIKKLKVNETSYIGVVAEDPNACYAGIIQQIHSEVGTDKTNLTLFAITIVRNRGVYVYRTGLYGSEPIASMLSKLKDHVSAFYAANK